MLAVEHEGFLQWGSAVCQLLSDSLEEYVSESGSHTEVMSFTVGHYARCSELMTILYSSDLYLKGSHLV